MCKHDMKAMSGYWKPMSVVANGAEQFPDAKSRDAITLAIANGESMHWRVTDPVNRIGEKYATATLKLDAATKGIEITITRGAQKGLKCHGIYELKDGKLRLCYGPVDKPKPTKFEAPEGSFCFCETWTPEK